MVSTQAARELPHPAPTRMSALFRVLPWALLALFSVLSWIQRAPAMLTRQDDARYLGLARAIRMGTYRDFMWPGAPWHHMYPPGFPALLAVWTAIGGERFDWLVVLHILLAVLSLGVTFLAVRRGMSPLIAILSLVVLAVSPRYVTYAGQVGSEGALALCFAAALWASVALPDGRRQVVILVALSMLAPLMRSAGMALPAAVGLCWLSQRRYRDAAVLTAVGVVVLGALMAWTLADPVTVAGSSYVGDLAFAGRGHAGFGVRMAQRLMASMDYYLARSIPVLLAMPTIGGTIVDNIIGASLISVGLLVGTLRSYARFRVASLLLVMSGLLLAVWPYQQFRFLVPLTPLLVPIILYGLEALIARLKPSAATAGITALSLVFMLSGLKEIGSEYRATRGCVRGRAIPADNCVSPDQASFFHAAVYVRDSLPKQARVLSAKSEPLFIYSGHTTLPTSLWLGRDTTAFWEGLRREQAEYVLLGTLHVTSVRDLAPRLRSHCDALEVVAAFPPHTYLFRITAPAPGRIAACDTLDAYRKSVRLSEFSEQRRITPYSSPRPSH